MSWRRALTLMVIFFLDVHVKAEPIADCWGERIPCAVKAKNQRTLAADEFKVSMAPSALLEQRDPETIQLVNGRFYVETESPVKFQTPYAKVWCEAECKALFTRFDASLTVKSLGGRWLIQRNGEKTVYGLPAGLQMLIGEVSTDGQAEMEFPQSLPWASTLQEWAALYPGDMAEFKPTLVKFRQAWKKATEKVSDMQKAEAGRMIASFEKNQAGERARQRAREREDENLRVLFREKNP